MPDQDIIKILLFMAISIVLYGSIILIGIAVLHLKMSSLIRFITSVTNKKENSEPFNNSRNGIENSEEEKPD